MKSLRLPSVVLVVVAVLSIEAKAGPALDGLAGWYQASSLSLTNGQPVSSWADLSGNGNTLQGYASGGTYETNVLNGLPVVVFTGGFFNNSSMAGLSGTSFEMFAVITNFTNGSVADLGASGNIENNEAILGYLNGTSVYHESSSGNYSYLENQVSPGTSPYILEGVYGNSASDLSSFVNGVESTDTVLTNNSPQDYTSQTRQLTVGVRDANLSGDIAELLVYDNTLTPEEEQQTGSYLQSEYNISGSYSVPESATWASLAAGVASLFAFRRRS